MASIREEEKLALFARVWEEVNPDEIHQIVLRSSKTTPAGGGGPAGAVWVASVREEEKAGLIRQGLGGGKP